MKKEIKRKGQVSEEKQSKLYNIWNIGLISIFILYAFYIVLTYLSFDFNRWFGYLDYQLFWQGLSDLAQGKVIYRDFYWEYGLLYLIIGLPIFLILGKTFISSIIIRLIFFPIIGIIASFFIGKQLFRKKSILIYMLLSSSLS